MAYEKRVWSETEKETAYPSDFNRIEEGIEVNDLEITNQKNPTIPGTLANKINVLTNFNKILDSGTDIFTFANNNNFGLYQANPNTVINLPSFSTTEIAFVRIINKHLIECTDLYSTKIYRSTKVNDAWQPWQPIATTTKTSFTCVPFSNTYTIVWQNCYVKNGIKYIHLRIKKTDNTVFEAVQHAIFTTPYPTTVITPMIVIPYGDVNLGGMGNGNQNGVLWNNSNGYITPTTANSYGFEIKCAYE